ncbi:hypothetical protein HYU09_04815 [Candidatus Woesearchaeota archaeon]|nr:hypothetical protein [Candidatus Woesearchaeota archaeon]
MVQKFKCDSCGKIIEEAGDFYKVTAVMKKGSEGIQKNFCGLSCANAWSLANKKKFSMKETLEEEIKEAVAGEKENVGEGPKIPEQQEILQDISQKTLKYEKSLQSGAMQKTYSAGNAKPEYASETGKADYIIDQDFYIRREEDIGAVQNAMKEIKSRELGMSRVDDSDLWEIEPETKKLKVRKMPRGTLDMLKQKGIVIDYYKQL